MCQFSGRHEQPGIPCSVDQHQESLAASFERRARGQLHRIADELAETNDDDVEEARLLLQRETGSNDNLIGLRFTRLDNHPVESGQDCINC